MSEDMSDFYESLNEAQSDKQVVLSVMTYSIMIMTVPIMIIMIIVMLSPTILYALIGSLATGFFWAIGYQLYYRSIQRAVAGKDFLFLDNDIGGTLFEEQICINDIRDIVEPARPFSIEELKRDMSDIDATLELLSGMSVGDIKHEQEKDQMG